MHRYALAAVLIALLVLPQALMAQESPSVPPVRPAPSAPVTEAPATMPGMTHDRMPSSPHVAPGTARDDMRTMTIAMGAMAGYMVVAMPVTVAAVLAGAAGGYAARWWYDRRDRLAAQGH